MQDITQSPDTNVPVTLETLPDEIKISVKRSRIALVVISSVITVIALNVLVSISGLDGYTGGYLEQKWNILRTLDQPVDWLILGDSSADQGVIPALFESSLGGSAVNLGTVGNTLAIDDVWMLDEYINRFGAPKNVVIVHVYDMWHRDVEASVFAKMPLPLGFWWSRNPSLSLSVSESVEILAFRYLPLYQSKDLLKSIAADPGRLLLPAQPIMPPDGFTGYEEARPDNVELDLLGHKSLVLSRPYELSDDNRQALDRLVELADMHQFSVFIANSPIYDGLKRDNEFQAYFASVQDLLIDLDERSPNINYVLCDTPGFSKQLMTGVDHVIVEGARSFTEQLIQSIAVPSTCEKLDNE